jgi:glycerophosphoryl diester phosphodiesterase
MEIIAHRGASHDAPENTLAAVRLAWAQHADAVEVDVHLTRDRRLAVIHDPDTQRTSGQRRVVAASTLAELQQLDVGQWKDARFAGERIPVLEDVLALVPDGKRVFVEVKGGPEAVPALERCIAIAKHEQRVPLRAEQIAIITFDLRTAIAAKRALPAHEVCWLAEAGAEAPHPSLTKIAAVARDAGLDGIDVDAAWPITKDLVQQIRRERFKLYVWTVDDAPVAQRLVAAGVDALTTNRPGWLRAQICPS